MNRVFKQIFHDEIDSYISLIRDPLIDSKYNSIDTHMDSLIYKSLTETINLPIWEMKNTIATVLRYRDYEY